MCLLSVVALTILARAACVTAQAIDLRSYRDETYAVKATIGTALKGQPNQEFYLAVDAFGSETKVAAVGCWQCCEKVRYDASLSSSNKGSCKALADGADGTKTEACSDTFQSGTLTFPGAPFTEVISSPLGSAFLSLPSDGIVGLADKVHGFYFARTCSNDVAKGGSIMVGALDAASCDTTRLTTLALTTSTDANKALSTQLSKYQVGAEKEVVPIAPTTWFATFTTASPNITIPKDQFDTLNAKYWKAELDNIFDCKNSPPSTTIKLTFAGAAAPSLSFDIQQLAFQTDDGKCALRLNAQTENAKQNYWEFGLPLFRTYCSLVDVVDPTKASIKFAAPRVTPNSVCTYTKRTALPACDEPETAESTISPSATQAPSQTTAQKGASRGQVMSVVALFVTFAVSTLFLRRIQL